MRADIGTKNPLMQKKYKTKHGQNARIAPCEHTHKRHTFSRGPASSGLFLASRLPPSSLHMLTRTTGPPRSCTLVVAAGTKAAAGAASKNMHASEHIVFTFHILQFEQV